MSLSKSKCWYSNNCLHLLKRTVPLQETDTLAYGVQIHQMFSNTGLKSLFLNLVTVTKFKKDTKKLGKRLRRNTVLAET
jgi:hypothetical protein